jgi:hypothetical protein
MKLVRSGSLFVHINIITILVGIVVGRFGEKGFLQVFEGEKNGKMLVDKGFVKNPRTGKMEKNIEVRELPFEVALIRRKQIIIWMRKKPPFPFALRTFHHQISFYPTQFLEHARVETNVIRVSDEYKKPALRLAVGTPEKGIQARWIFANQLDPHSFIEQRVHIKHQNQSDHHTFEWFTKSRALGPFASLMIFLVSAYSVFFLDSTISPLVPALQSYWLWIHVAVTVISYGAFAIAFMAAFQFLLKQSFK